MKLGPFQEVILESSSVEELKEKVCLLHDKCVLLIACVQCLAEGNCCIPVSNVFILLAA